MCPSANPSIPRVSGHPLGGAPGSPVDIQADRVELEGETATFIGNVIVQYGSETLYADRARYNKTTDEIQASGNVRLVTAMGDELETPLLQLVRETGVGFTQAVTFKFAENGARGDARQIVFRGRELVRLEGSRYTRCPQGQDDWFIVASDIELDYDREVGSARHARIKFKSVPIFYWPYMTFPLSDRRKSGFLAPVFGTDTKNGFFFAAPYYFNIAPRLDSTLTPRYLSKRGLQFQSETRYLGRSYDGTLNADYLANDRLRGGNRSFNKLLHHHYFNRHWLADVDLNNVSDPNYFEDFSFSVADAAATHIPQKFEIRYADETWRGLGRLFRYQTLDPAGTAGIPYSRLPEILLTGDLPTGRNRLRYRVDADAANFEHPSKVSGQRVGVTPSVSWPLENSYAYAIPKLGARTVAYQLAEGANDTPGETVPIASLDLGLNFERMIALRGAEQMQTLEPRLFYAYIPYRNQDDQPNFDTGPQDFNYSNLFRENRFFGGDRVGDANQLTAGVTSRVLDGTGAEWLRASLGEVFYFDPPRVFTPEQQAAAALQAGAPTAERSLLVEQLRARVSPTVYVRHDLQWDDRRARTTKSSSFIQYRPKSDRIVNFGHRYVNNAQLTPSVLEQIELSTQWPVSQRWTVLARQSHSLIDDSNLESFIGFQYNACCWLGRLYIQRRVTQELGVSNLYYFEFELSGLLKLGAAPIPSPLAAGSFIFD